MWQVHAKVATDYRETRQTVREAEREPGRRMGVSKGSKINNGKPHLRIQCSNK